MTIDRSKLEYVFFDLDNTLTASRQKITDDMLSVFCKMCKKYKVFIVSGADFDQISTQVPLFTQIQHSNETCTIRPSILAQNGNFFSEYDSLAGAGDSGEYVTIWENKLNWLEKTLILNWVESVFLDFSSDIHSICDLVEDRGCQISYSTIGHHAPSDIKKAFDPSGNRRREILRLYPFDSSFIDVSIAGTTCFDFYKKGRNKGGNIRRVLDLKKIYDEDKCLYVGDALFEKGNDESVMGVVPYVNVGSPDVTLELIKSLL